MARKYTKKNEDYWNGLKQGQRETAQSAFAPQAPADLTQPAFDDQPHFSAVAACGGGSPTNYRDGTSPSITQIDSYRNIDSMILPWETSNGTISVSRAILLSQKAYAGVAIVKNSIESSVEFSNSELYIETENQTVKDFFTEWLNLINIYKLKDNVFREYYRSGNVPIYKFSGRIQEEDYGRMKTVFGAKSPILPIRYVILNPAQVSVQGGLGYEGSYVKVLSRYEVERLANPRTEQDRQVFNSLPADVKKQIKAGSGLSNILIPLDADRLTMLFYKKQDYEPMAMPMIYPVLNDLEWKLELKKMDMTVGRMIEHAILLVTAGEPADQYNSRYNPQNIVNLQSIFRNQTLGRVLVGDYTTKAQWVIPPIAEILGPQKYAQVEADIKEGLQSIIMGEDKFANAQIKARVFIERMKEGQKAFLNNFLLPEIKFICEQMNFKNVPSIKFAEINLNDPSTIARVYLRLAELGLITPAETIAAIETGLLPSKAGNLLAQEEYKSQREKGLYEPLLGGGKDETKDNGRPAGSKTPKSTNKMTPQGMGSETEAYSSQRVMEIIPAANDLKDQIVSALKKKFKVKGGLTSEQVLAATTLAKVIITKEEQKDWNSVITKYLNELPEMDAEAAKQIDSLALEHDLDDWSAVIVWKAKKK